MRFVDKVYDYYRDHLNGDEEDLLAIVVDILSEHDRKEMLSIIDDMEEDELYQMLGMYMIEILRHKASEEGIGSPKSGDSVRYH